MQNANSPGAGISGPHRNHFFKILRYTYPMRLLVLLLALIPASSLALGTTISSGTGFFVSKYGDIVTNAHVVDGCDTVTIRGAIPASEARVLAADTDIDLALLRTSAIPPRIAFFRGYGSRIGKDDEVLLIGYPGESGITGEYQITPSVILGTHGPLGNKQWLQFQDAARHGNSGGPLLDASGNVVGVITGKSTLTRTNPETGQEDIIQQSDVAVTLDYLQAFLKANHVGYALLTSAQDSGLDAIESAARDYVVNIHCRQ